jgi:hypothetical protein
MFEPWIGKHYRDTGLLLLGESSYSWEVDGRKVTDFQTLGQADCQHT